MEARPTGQTTCDFFRRVSTTALAIFSRVVTYSAYLLFILRVKTAGIYLAGGSRCDFAHKHLRFELRCEKWLSPKADKDHCSYHIHDRSNCFDLCCTEIPSK